jgi:putative DNA primase/helicase
MPTQGIAFVYAATGVGKTLFTLNLAYAIAAGGNFLKYSCPKRRRVLYIDGEMSYQQMHSRLVEISKCQGQMFDENYFQLLTPDKSPNQIMPKIDDPLSQELYNKIIEMNNIEVIVIDNLSALSSFDEKDISKWKPIQDWVLSLRAKGKSVIIVHHAGKDKNGYRGTSGMLDCIDVAISLQSIEEDLPEEAAQNSPRKIKVVYHKNRIFGGGDSLPYEISIFNSEWSYRTLEMSNLDRVTACWDAEMRQIDIAKELLISQTTVSRLIKKLRKMGRIK